MYNSYFGGLLIFSFIHLTFLCVTSSQIIRPSFQFHLYIFMITSMHSILAKFYLCIFLTLPSPTQSNCPSPLLFSISCSSAQHNVFRCGNKSQFLSPLSYLSHLHVPGLSDISDVERNLSELSVTSSVDSGFRGSGHSFRLRDRSPVRCKCAE